MPYEAQPNSDDLMNTYKYVDGISSNSGCISSIGNPTTCTPTPPLPSIDGVNLDITRDASTRYWFSTSPQFLFNHLPITQTTSVTINMVLTQFNQFDSDTSEFYCVTPDSNGVIETYPYLAGTSNPEAEADNFAQLRLYQ